MSEVPRYRCAAEKGFFRKPVSIAFAKLNGQVGIGQRAEEGDEFDWDEAPNRWMIPLNAAAHAAVEQSVSDGRRKGAAAEGAAHTKPLKMPPKSGMTRAITDPDGFSNIVSKPIVTDERVDTSRPAPRRRAKSN